MEPAPAASPLRPLAPSGAPGVGDPPVSAHEVVSASRRDGDDAWPKDAAATARRAFPWLSVEQVDAALAQAALDPAPLTPRLTPGQALSLGVVLGMGMLFCATGVIGLAATAWVVLMSSVLELAPARLPSAAMLVFVLVSATLSVLVGRDLLRLQRWARFGGALLTFLLVAIPALLSGEPPSAFAGGACLCAQLLLLTSAGRWTTADGRAAARAVPTRPFVQVVAWGCLVTTALLAFVPAFARMFKQVGVSLSYGTAALFDLADVVESWQLLIPAALLATSVPLLRLAPRHERPASWGAGVLGFAALGSIIGWLVLPLFELIHKL